MSAHSTDARQGPAPYGWEASRLGRLAEITKLAGFEYTSHFNSYRDGGDVVVIRGTNITRNRLDLSDVRMIPRSVSNKLPRSQLKKGDLAFAYVGTIGPVLLVDGDRRYHLGPNTARVTCTGQVHPGFLFHYFQGGPLRKEIDERISVGAQPSLSMAKIRDFRIVCPPPKEQEAIAEALSDADALIELLEQLVAKKRLIKHGAMQELLTGKTRLPGFSGEWETKRLGGLGSFLKGKGVSKAEALSGVIPCIRYGELYTRHRCVIRYFYSWISPRVAATATRLEYGDILFAGSGETKEEIGVCAAFVSRCPTYAGGDIVILRPDRDDPVFLGYYLNSPMVSRQKSSVGQGDAVVHISALALAEVRGAFPHGAEQTAIASVLSDMDAEIDAIEARLAKTRLIKQGMMQELLTGRIRLV